MDDTNLPSPADNKNRLAKNAEADTRDKSRLIWLAEISIAKTSRCATALKRVGTR